jgi:hypothetical protein
VNVCRSYRDRHEDAFAADYQEEKYRLIGMAIKFAGICGKEVRIHGRNRETVEQTAGRLR